MFEKDGQWHEWAEEGHDGGGKIGQYKLSARGRLSSSTRTPDAEYPGAFTLLRSIIFGLGQVLGPLLMAAVEPLLELGGAYFGGAYFLIR